FVNALAPAFSDIERLAFRRSGEAERNAEFRFRSKPKFAMGREKAIDERKCVNDLRGRTAAKKLRAVGRPCESVERFIERNLGNGLAALQIDNPNFVLRVATMEHRGVTAIWMQCDIDRKIADDQLTARGAQRPLIRQQDGAVELQAGK